MKDPHITWTLADNRWGYTVHPPAKFGACLAVSGKFVFVQLIVNGRLTISRLNLATGRWGYPPDRCYSQGEMDEPYDTKEPG